MPEALDQFCDGHLVGGSQIPRRVKSDQPERLYCMPSRKRIKMYKAKIKKISEMSLIPKGSFLARHPPCTNAHDVAHERSHKVEPSIQMTYPAW